MNIFKELNKLPHTDINEVDYGRGIDYRTLRTKIYFEGKSAREWAEELDVTISCIKARIKKNGNPFYRGDRNFIGNGVSNWSRPRRNSPWHEGKTYVEWAKELGISHNLVHSRMKSHGHPYNKTTCRKMGLL